MKKRLLAALVCTMMVLALLPAAALADDEKTTLDIDEGSITISESGVEIDKGLGVKDDIAHDPDGYKIIGGGTSTSNTITVTGGEHSITLHNVNINASFAIQPGAKVDLELSGANVLTSGSAGLYVPSGATVEITGTGSLTATGFVGSAGIGGIYAADCGTVNISGGTVTISGGNVKATGSGGSADIGGGGYGGSGGTLQNANGVDVYLVTLTLDGASISNSTPIAGLNATGISYTYGMDGVKPLDGNKLYLYLPEGTVVNSVTTGDTLPRLFTNQTGADILVAGDHSSTGTLTEVATATISNVTVSGMTGTEITPMSVTVTLTGEKFVTLNKDADVSGWFTNLPDGLSAKVETEVNSGATSVQIAFSGTPTAASTEAIVLTVPGNRLITYKSPLTSENDNARWAITSSAPHQIIRGQNGKWAKGSTTGLSFTSNGEYRWFDGVVVDGHELSDDQYTAQSGSTIVTLKAAYLESLSVGRHTLRMNFEGGPAETDFTILEETAEAAVPETGDPAQPILWLGTALLAGALLISSAVLRRRRQNG